MNDNNPQPQSAEPTFFQRILSNDSAKKGAAAALAGIVVAVVQEAFWPSK